MRPSFNLTFTEIRIYGPHEQCIGFTEKTPNAGNFSAIQTQHKSFFLKKKKKKKKKEGKKVTLFNTI